MKTTTPSAVIAAPIGARSARVVYLEGPRQLAWRTEALPEHVPDDAVLCQTIVTAISPGTELAAYLGLPPLREGIAYPRVQGYCNVAAVLACGSGVRSLKAGDRVLTSSSHRSHFVIPEREVLLRLWEDVVPEEAACSYLFHLGYNAVLRADVRPGSRVLVVGLGVLGLSTVAMAHLAGADVLALSEHGAQRALAVRLGARRALRRADSVEIDSALGDVRADVVVVTTNAWSDWEIALRAAGQRATIAVLGFPGRGQLPSDFNPLDSRWFYAKQLRIEAVGHSPELRDTRGFARFNERDNLRWLNELISEKRLPAALLISGTFPAEQIEQAYLALIERNGSPVTYILRWV